MKRKTTTRGCKHSGQTSPVSSVQKDKNSGNTSPVSATFNKLIAELDGWINSREADEQGKIVPLMYRVFSLTSQRGKDYVKGSHLPSWSKVKSKYAKRLNVTPRTVSTWIKDHSGELDAPERQPKVPKRKDKTSVEILAQAARQIAGTILNPLLTAEEKWTKAESQALAIQEGTVEADFPINVIHRETGYSLSLNGYEKDFVVHLQAHENDEFQTWVGECTSFQLSKGVGWDVRFQQLIAQALMLRLGIVTLYINEAGDESYRVNTPTPQAPPTLTPEPPTEPEAPEAASDSSTVDGLRQEKNRHFRAPKEILSAVALKAFQTAGEGDEYDPPQDDPPTPPEPTSGAAPKARKYDHTEIDINTGASWVVYDDGSKGVDTVIGSFPPPTLAPTYSAFWSEQGENFRCSHKHATVKAASLCAGKQGTGATVVNNCNGKNVYHSHKSLVDGLYGTDTDRRAGTPEPVPQVILPPTIIQRIRAVKEEK